MLMRAAEMEVRYGGESVSLETAIERLEQAVRLDPTNAAAAHANLGWALLQSGKPQESIPEFEAALQLNPEFKAATDGLRQAQAQLIPQR